MNTRSAAGSKSALASGGPLLVLEDLCIEFNTPRGWVRVVDNLNLEVADGETVGLVGESGCGKTVTVQSILGLLSLRGGRASSGRIWFDGRELRGATERELRTIRGDEISMIFQEPMTSLNPAFTVGNQIAETVQRHRDVNRKEAWARAVEMLSLVGIPDAVVRAREYPHTFSGGMRQRAMIAMALSCDPKLLLADEPTTALDVTIQSNIMRLLAELQDRFGMAMILVTHDLLLAAENCRRIAVMYAGQIVEDALSEEVYHRPMHPYTEGLLRSLPQSADEQGWLHPIMGTVPMPWNRPIGCRFHPRCQYYDESRCVPDPVPVTVLDGGRRARCVRVGELALDGPLDLDRPNRPREGTPSE